MLRTSATRVLDARDLEEARALRKLGYAMIVPPESFLVDGDNHLVGGEVDRAVTWGQHVSAQCLHTTHAA